MALPVVIAAWAFLIAATGLAYLYMFGIIAIAMGFAAVGLVWFAKRKWSGSVVCLLLCIGTLLYAYGYLSGLV
jgi:hypothetical protein